MGIIAVRSLKLDTRLYMVFVDFEKVFDSVDCKMLLKILRHYRIQFKIVRMPQCWTASTQECDTIIQGCAVNWLNYCFKQARTATELVYFMLTKFRSFVDTGSAANTT